MEERLHPFPKGAVKLLPGLFQHRSGLNRQYLISLKTENLLQNFYMEAGLWGPRGRSDDIHWGWEAPTCQLRGHFLGHWLSAAAFIAANTGDQEIKGKADYIISELARCQQENGGEWVGSIPEKYLDWVARGKRVWAPHYTLHKTLMGLWDMYSVGGNSQALDILVKWARWFHRWSSQFSREEMDDILDVETGGMLEVWANLYGFTGEPEHHELMQRYDRQRLFDPLVAGEDVLTNMHMNTTVPEAQGAARAWEVTGEPRWKKIVEAYWRSGVTDRGYFVTGGQSNGEIWTPPNSFSARLGFRTQEHCTVYNMMRLADYLFRWSGDPIYADYWERNLWNGILAQQHPETGMIAYFLPMNPGGVKVWGTPTEDFWCCHGSLVQAHTIYPNHIWFESQDGITLSQYIPSEASLDREDNHLSLKLKMDPQLEEHHRPEEMSYTLHVHAEQPQEFTLGLRLPWWLSGAPVVSINGKPLDVGGEISGYLEIRRLWDQDSLHIQLPKNLVSVPLPDEQDMYAFMDGPVVLAGLNPVSAPAAPPRKDGTGFLARPDYQIRGISLVGDPDRPETFLTPDNEREWIFWRGDYRTRGQGQDFRFIPLHEIRDELFTVYFPISNGY
jgi:DUF1680 family protein